MKFQLDINCDNAAFEDGDTAEVARILQEAANSMRNRGNLEDMARSNSGIILRDSNGNTVGIAQVSF